MMTTAWQTKLVTVAGRRMKVLSLVSSQVTVFSDASQEECRRCFVRIQEPSIRGTATQCLQAREISR